MAPATAERRTAATPTALFLAGAAPFGNVEGAAPLADVPELPEEVEDDEDDAGVTVTPNEVDAGGVGGTDRVVPEEVGRPLALEPDELELDEELLAAFGPIENEPV